MTPHALDAGVGASCGYRSDASAANGGRMKSTGLLVSFQNRLERSGHMDLPPCRLIAVLRQMGIDESYQGILEGILVRVRCHQRGNRPQQKLATAGALGSDLRKCLDDVVGFLLQRRDLRFELCNSLFHPRIPSWAVQTGGILAC